MSIVELGLAYLESCLVWLISALDYLWLGHCSNIARGRASRRLGLRLRHGRSLCVFFVAFANRHFIPSASIYYTIYLYQLHYTLWITTLKFRCMFL